MKRLILFTTLIGFLLPIAFGAGVAYCKHDQYPDLLTRVDNANHWECRSELVYNPNNEKATQ